MRSIGVREFRDQATTIMSAGETIVIERHGKPIGFFVPIEAKDRVAGRAALGHLGDVFDRVMSDTNLDEDDIVREIADHRRR